MTERQLVAALAEEVKTGDTILYGGGGLRLVYGTQHGVTADGAKAVQLTLGTGDVLQAPAEAQFLALAA